MKEFYKKVFFKGLKILLIVLIIQIIYFILNFINPNLFNFLRFSNKNNNTVNSTSTVVEKKSLGYRIYDLLFKSNSKEQTAASISKVSKWNASSTTWGDDTWVWGDTHTVWGSSKKSPLIGQTFISPNTSKSPIRGMKINNTLINEKNFNYVYPGDMISGSIFTGFLDSVFFDADIYDIDGNFLFFLPVTSSYDILSPDSFVNFHVKYDSDLNYQKYKGNGYLIIHSNNLEVTGAVLLKITFK